MKATSICSFAVAQWLHENDGDKGMSAPMLTSRNVHFMSASECAADVEFAIADIR